jgi:hypothetical protein
MLLQREGDWYGQTLLYSSRRGLANEVHAHGHSELQFSSARQIVRRCHRSGVQQIEKIAQGKISLVFSFNPLSNLVRWFYFIYLYLSLVCDGMSLLEYCFERADRSPSPFALPPLAGSNVGLAAVVMV